ncbi:MAG TPA: hypothetical protein VNG51_10740 [Ktedonobacteraceae bacterium]|nr:hypothetical protein [Ktedonobacteraceae bacterium]
MEDTLSRETKILELQQGIYQAFYEYYEYQKNIPEDFQSVFASIFERKNRLSEELTALAGADLAHKIHDKCLIGAVKATFPDIYAREQNIATNRARLRGEIKASQKVVVTIIEGRFPELVELAQRKVTNINKIDALALMIRMVSTVPDETTARFILNTKVA